MNGNMNTPKEIENLPSLIQSVSTIDRDDVSSYATHTSTQDRRIYRIECRPQNSSEANARQRQLQPC